MRPHSPTPFLSTTTSSPALSMPSLDNVSQLLTICAEALETFLWTVWQTRTGLLVMPFGPNGSHEFVDIKKKDFKKAKVFFAHWEEELGSQKRLQFIQGRSDAFQEGRVIVKEWAGKKWAEWQVSELVSDVLDRYGFKLFDFPKALAREQVFLLASIVYRTVY